MVNNSISAGSGYESLLFDTHTHYDDERYNEDRDLLISGLKAKGVGYAMNISADMASAAESMKLAEKYDFIYTSTGIHPHNASEADDENMKKLEAYAAHGKVKAIGEIGLDYYYDNSPREDQKRAFATQLDLAARTGLPVIIHDRDAHEDTMRIIREKKSALSGIVFHCYSGSPDMARELLKMGFFIAVGGALTFRNSRKLPEVVKITPLDKLLLETDCPYLAPDPYRGKRNDSGYLHLVAEKVAEIKGISYDETVLATTSNAIRFFAI